jgi:hypothetical protein
VFILDSLVLEKLGDVAFPNCGKCFTLFPPGSGGGPENALSGATWQFSKAEVESRTSSSTIMPSARHLVPGPGVNELVYCGLGIAQYLWTRE